MTREEVIENLKILKEDYWDDDGYGYETEKYNDTMLALDMAIKSLEQEPILNKIFCIVYSLSIMSTSELEHKAIMQIAEMLEPLCLSESEE